MADEQENPTFEGDGDFVLGQDAEEPVEAEEQADEAVEGGEQPDEAVEQYAESEEETEQEEPEASEQDVALAKALGWKSPDEWKGDRSGLIEDPKEYLRIHSRRIQEFGDVQEQLAATRRELLRLEKESKERFKQADETSLSQLRAERDRAFDLGDKKKFQALDKQLEERLRATSEETDEGPQVDETVRQATADPVYQEWLQENAWYKAQTFEDAAKHQYANNVARQLLEARNVSDPLSLPADARRDFYRAVAKEVNRAYGAPNPAPMQGRQQEAPTNTPPRRQPAAPQRGKNKTDFNALPGDAKDGFDKWVKMGVYKNDDKSRAEYAKDYFAQ